jgi:hypothetical protein
LSLTAALESIWQLIRDRPTFDLAPFPDFIYVRGKYLITPNFDGALHTPPLQVMRLDDGHVSEGVGLLGLLARLWLGGIQSHAARPWWLQAWEQQRASLLEVVTWPPDLQEQADVEQRRRTNCP